MRKGLKRRLRIPALGFIAVLATGCSGNGDELTRAEGLQSSATLMVYDPAVDVTTILYFNIWDQANLLTDQFPLLITAAREARAVVGY